MPKIIPELREAFISAARQRIFHSESHGFTTRQLAEDCGVAAGTVYNYFASREELLACVMLEDWRLCMDELNVLAKTAETVAEGFHQMERALRAFSEKFTPVWRGYDRRAPIGEHHSQLVRQIGESVSALLKRFHRTPAEAETAVLSEMLLAASLREPGTLEQLLPIIEKIIS